MAERKAGERESERERSAAGRRPDERERMQSSRAATSSTRTAAAAPPGTGAPVASSRSHYHQHPPSTARSSRYEGVPMSSSSSSMQRGPLTAERNMMETIRMKLERAQHRLAHQHAVQSATPGTSRYYPPNYESSKARTPAPAVKSVKLEDFSLQQQHYVTQPPPSSTTSGYMGVYPPQPPSTYRGGFADPRAAASQHHRHQQPQPSQHRDRAAAPATGTASTRPSRQSVPAPVHEPSARSTRPSAPRHHHQQYPAELQYKSASRNTATSDYQGTPLSSAAPFLVYSTSSRQPPPSTSQKTHHRQFAPPSPMQAPVPSARANNGATEADRQHRHHRHDRTREPPPSAMRSAMQAPPSSRVRFEGHLDEYEEEERARAKFEEDRAREAEKARLRQREKEQMHREFLLKERQKGSVSQDAAEQQLPVERQERTRRGSLPTPPKSEIDVNVWQHVKGPVPVSPSGRNRRSSSVVAAPPKSEIQVSGFDEAPVRRRSSAADQLPALSAEALAQDDPAKSSAKRDASSDEDDYTTPPTSPSSGASSSASGSSSGVSVSAKEKLIFEVAEATNVSEEPPIAVNVKPVPAFRDYDDDFFLKQQASPTKKAHLSIWEEDDEEAIISSSNQLLTPKQQDTKAPLIWNEEKENDKGDDKREEPVSKNREPLPKRETPEDIISKEETQSPEQESDNSENVPPSNLQDAPKKEAAPEISSNQVLPPVMKPAASPAPSSSAYLGSRSASSALEALRSKISAHHSQAQALNSPESAGPARASRLPPTSPSSRLSMLATAKASPPSPPTRSPPSPPTRSPPSPPTRSPPSQPPLHPASEPRAAPTSSMFPSRSSAAFQRPPSTTVGRPSVTRPHVPPLPPAPNSMYMSKHQHSSHGLPPSTGSTGQRRLPHREPLDLKRQLPSQISALEGLTSGTNTFPLNECAFYEIEWRTGEFGFSFQRVYSEAYENEKSEMFLRMLLNTERGTCRSFRDVHVGDILIKIGDVKVSDLGFDTARDPGLALTKYFTELRNQTPMRLVFQRTEVLDWEGGVEL